MKRFLALMVALVTFATIFTSCEEEEKVAFAYDFAITAWGGGPSTGTQNGIITYFNNKAIGPNDHIIMAGIDKEHCDELALRYWNEQIAKVKVTEILSIEGVTSNTEFTLVMRSILDDGDTKTIIATYNYPAK